MNIKPPLVILSSVLVLSSCSTAPTSQGIGKTLATGLVLGGAIMTSNKDAKNENDSDKKKQGQGLAAAGLVIYYLIARAEEKKKAILAKKRRKEQELIKREKARKKAIIKKKESIIRDNPNYRNIYTPKEINNFKKYYQKTKIKISPSTASVTGDPIYIDITAPHPYRSSQFFATQYLNLNHCSFSTYTRKKYDSEKNMIEIALEVFNTKSEITVKNINCKKIPQKIIRKRVKFFQLIGVKDNSSLMKLALKNNFSSTIKGNAGISFDKSFRELNEIARNNPTPLKKKKTSSSKSPKKTTYKKNKRLGKYSGGVKSITRKSSLRYNKYPQYRIVCNEGGTDTYYHYTEKFYSSWRRISFRPHYYLGKKYKTIESVAKKHCN